MMVIAEPTELGYMYDVAGLIFHSEILKLALILIFASKYNLRRVLKCCFFVCVEKPR